MKPVEPLTACHRHVALQVLVTRLINYMPMNTILCRLLHVVRCVLHQYGVVGSSWCMTQDNRMLVMHYGIEVKSVRDILET